MLNEAQQGKHTKHCIYGDAYHHHCSNFKNTTTELWVDNSSAANNFLVVRDFYPKTTLKGP
jgi:hypothetical protein